MQLKEDNARRIYASMLTALVIGIMLLLTFLIIFRTSLPPYPEGGGGGIGVNFGTSEDGLGDVQPEKFFPVETTSIDNTESENKTTVKVNAPSEKIVTQEIEDAPSVASADKPQKNIEVKPVSETPKPIKITEPVVNPMAAYKKKPKGTSEGETHGTGEMGNPNGSTNVATHNGVPGNGQGGYGTGTGKGSGSGNGNGNGNGNGSGSGNGNGNGVSFSLKGRKFMELTRPEYNSSEQGKVVVKIVVDANGNVVSANAGQQGSTTTNQGLWKLAERAALRSKFDKNPDAAEQQQGSITYIFIRQN